MSIPTRNSGPLDLLHTYMQRWRYRVSIAWTLVALDQFARGNKRTGVLVVQIARVIAPKRGMR